jgi:hypothetical protein
MTSLNFLLSLLNKLLFLMLVIVLLSAPQGLMSLKAAF